MPSPADRPTVPEREALLLWAKIVERATLNDYSEGRNEDHDRALQAQEGVAWLLRYVSREDVQEAIRYALDYCGDANVEPLAPLLTPTPEEP